MTVTLLIIALTALVSWRCFENPALRNALLHHPYSEAREKEYYRLLTGAFVHGSWTHLLVNMFVLYQFGTFVESVFTLTWGPTQGRIFYLLVYLLTAFLADIPTFLKHKDNSGFRSVGASGAVSGMLFIYIIFQPWSWLLLFFVIPIPAIVAAVGYLFYSSYANKRGGGRIDHSAHFYGAVVGFALAILLQPQWFMLFIDNVSNPDFSGLGGLF